MASSFDLNWRRTGLADLLADAGRDEPPRFSRLVLAGVGDTLLGPEDREPLARALEAGDPGAPGILGLFVRLAEGSGTDPLALAALLRRPSTPLTEDNLGRVACPVLLVLGDRDHAWPADRLLAAFPDARLKALKGVDHFATPTDFGFLDATLEFLDAAI